MTRYRVLALLLVALCGGPPLLVAAHAASATTDAAQVFSTPKGEAENVRFEQVAGGTVHIFYDLVSTDPRAVFEVTLEGSQDSGQSWSVRPKTVSGDVGPGIRVGPGKRIVWDSGKDVERLVIDQFRFRILAQAGPLEPQRPPAPAASPGGAASPGTAPKPGAGGMAIVTDPPGAQVSVDGTPRGDTPLTIDDLPAGAHKVVMTRAGYLEHSRNVTVVAGERAFLNVRLTPDQRTAPTPGTTQPAAAKQGGGGGSAKWIAIAGGAAAAGLAVALSGGGDPPTPPTPPTGGGGGGGGGGTVNRPPTITSVSVTPTGTLLAAATIATFEVNASDPDSNPMTATWSVGPPATSTTLSGGRATLRVQFSNAGIINPSVTVSDGQASASENYGAITVGTVTGLWTGRLGPPGCAPPSGSCYTIRANLVQNGSNVGGDYEDQFGRGSRVQGSVRDPRGMTLTVTVGPHPIPGGGGTITFNFSGNANLQMFTGIAGDSPVTISR